MPAAPAGAAGLKTPGAREGGPSAPCRACAAAPNRPWPAAPRAGSASDKEMAASLSRNRALRPRRVGGCQQRRHLPADPAIRLAHHLDHAGLDEAAGLFEPLRVERPGDLDRLAP